VAQKDISGQVNHAGQRENSMPAEGIQLSTEVMELGIDSMDFVEPIFETEKAFDIKIPTECYREFNTMAAINSSRYFNNTANMLGVRDLIIVCDTATATTHFCTVLSNTGSGVDVSNDTAVSETDGD